MRLIFSCVFFILIFSNKIHSQRGGDCAPATAVTDLHANEVKATLLNGGDMWWDTDDGAYFAPYNGPNQQTPSSLFAGGIWMGGIDPGGSIKLAAKTYGSGSGQTDFYPGPLNQFTGTAFPDQCGNWDRFFEVTSAEINSHLWRFGQSNYNEALIPKGVKEWPAKGNPFFEAAYGFELPDTGQGLADFYDENRDGVYNPLDGDYPALIQRGCNTPSIPDQMIFWVFNDAGGIHTESTADPMQMEFQVTAFAYDQPNAMGLSTFYKYKIINRAIEDLRDAYFGLWMDPDLGCYTDDYIGCDTSRNMAYIYNQDELDGQVGTNCPGGVNTFGDNVPMVGVDFFQGPIGEGDPTRDSFGNVIVDSLTLDTIFETVELGMSSFIHYNNHSVNHFPAGSLDPQNPEEFYNYLKGKWRDGSPITFGGSGYQSSNQETSYMYPSSPDCASSDCWSLCNANLGESDRRTIQSVGPMDLKPGDFKEIIFGVISTFGAKLPCPSLDKLGADDDFIQAAFDNCLQFQETPDPPTVNWEVGDQYLRGKISNRDNSNNYQERFESVDIIAPDNIPVEDRLYKFEGYKIFQIENEYVGWSNLNDPTKARLVYQTDIQNGIEEIFNWKLENGNWISEPKVNATNTNSDFELTFELEKDAFTGDDFENEKVVHFAALAYAHNNWQTFDSQTLVGQRTPYLEGRLKTSSAIPTLVPPYAGLGTVDVITRLDGVGAGRRFLDMTDEMHDIILNQNFDGTINYRGDRAPFEVRITDPDKLGGRFELTFIDENLNDDKLDGEIKWQLTNLDNPSEVFVSESDIITYEEFSNYGFAIHNRMGLEPGNNRDERGDPANGAIGDEYVYENPTAQWYDGIPDDFSPQGVDYFRPEWLDFIQNDPNGPDHPWDPDQKLSKMGNGFFVPYFLCDYRATDRGIPFITPAWTQQGGLVRQQLSQADLNNVDIVFTSDKSKWSRCIIVESSSPSLTQFGFTTENLRNHFDLRGAPSVGKEDANGDGLPDPDGDGEGMGWFPGYAIDVETGQRLNIFFGESSIYRCDEPFFSDFLNACENGIFDDNAPTGADMMWNPTSQIGIENAPVDFQTPDALWLAIAGGQHFIYVTQQPYDGCVELRDRFRAGINPLFKARAFGDVTWTGLPVLPEGEKLNSYADGIIPNDLTVKLRVDNSYKVYEGTNDKNGYPTYIFSTGNTISNTQEIAIENPLDEIILSPNPIYSKIDQQLTISNLPTKSHVKIFDVNGKIVDDLGRSSLTSVVWNPEGKLASGMYLVQIEHAVWGRKILKWVCL